MNLYCFLTFALLLTHSKSADIVKPAPIDSTKVNYLEAGETFSYVPISKRRGFFERELRTYCYKGEDKTLGRLFETVELILEIEGDDYTQYDGATPEDVQQHYDDHRSLFSFNLFSQKRSRLTLSPFASNCLGVETIEPYRIRLHRIRVDFWRVIQLLIALIAFQYAGGLSNNSLFYYITGVTLGICSSFMLLIWLSSKLVPRKTMMYGVLIGGWTIGLYVIQMLWENLQVIIVTYRTYVFWYILVTGIVSFFFCYRWGPPTNKRSKNIVKWLLQLMSLVLIYLSSHYEEATAAFIIIAIIIHYFPRSLWYKGRAFWLRKFPPKRRLLTSEEYYEQGVRETTKSLEELRKFASSPECRHWRLMSKLRDPMRFAAFVEGASHLRDEEILHYESSRNGDDDSDSDISLNDSEAEENIQYHYDKSQRSQMRRQTRDDISEDEDLNDGYEGRGVGDSIYRSGVSLMSNDKSRYNYSRTSTNSPPKQRLRNLTPTTTNYRSSSYSSVTRSATRRASARRDVDGEYSDE
ncbi:nuclear envelope integral membrane protein [Stomoxys calcitrans]|uniref:nuclear envelope integral membrane protein n=1 Tax=Stomoxys calcitrans TaxID=35570 RepID=UPI0027E36E91|nr:nuclear envelope integral membrane protein [Stomoxys calcitrans]